MRGINSVVKVISNPNHLIMSMAQRGLFNWLPDKQYLELIFPAHMGYKLDLKSPKTYSEKLQWLKLYDRKQKYCSLVDKFEVKQYVASIIGDEFVIPTLGIWDKAEDIDISKLPDKFVLKCTHDSGSVTVCQDKAHFDIEHVKKQLAKHMRHNMYLDGREWPYKDVKPRIIAEQYMEDPETRELRDYKFFCFSGKVKAMFIATSRQSTKMPTAFDFFDANFNHLDVRQGHPNAPEVPERPKQFELMKELAEKLSKDLLQVRVDFYEVSGKVYFGELTLFHFGGIEPFDPPEWDKIFGDWLSLPIEQK